MWFKNCRLYRLTKPLPFKIEEFNEILQKQALQACPKSQPHSRGWVSPFGKDSDVFVHGSNGYWLFALGKEERILPSSVLREAVDEKVEEIQTKQDRKVSSKEKMSIKDEITFTLLPKAFTKRSTTFAYLDTQNNWLVIDASSPKQAETLTQFLRECLNSLATQLPETLLKPTQEMTQWLLKDSCPVPFFVQDSCVLIDPDNRHSNIRCKNIDLTADEFINHLKDGMQVSQISMRWHNRLSFTLSEDLSLRSIRFMDVLQEIKKDQLAESKTQQIDQDFALMTGEFSLLISELYNCFNGLKDVTESTGAQITEAEMA